MARRTSRVAIDQSDVWFDKQYYDRDTNLSPGEDYVVYRIPSLLRGTTGLQTDLVTIWGQGFVSVGLPTSAQIDFMESNPRANPSLFPGSYIFFAEQGTGFSQDSIFVGSTAEGAFISFSAPGSANPPFRSDIVFRQENFTPDVTISFRLGSASAPSTVVGGSLLRYDTYFVRTGSAGDDTMSAGRVSEALDGADGADFLIGSEAGDRLLGGSGSDTLFGLEGTDSLVGGDGNDVLDGGAGIDTMAGGQGSDIYFVRDVGDIVIEAGPAGEIDEIRTTLASFTLSGVDNVEQLMAVGPGSTSLTGNGFANTLTGGSGNDSLNGGGGNDVLIGGAGNDFMAGGAGSDIYIVEDVGDGVSETGSDIDEIRTSLASFTLPDSSQVEQLLALNAAGQALTGNASNNTLSGSVGNDTLNGGAGNDVLIGGAGNDSLVGGAGLDIYFVDAAGDVVVETGGDIDEIRTSLTSYTLGEGSGVEQLLGLNSTGQALTGNSGNNTLTGGAGNDLLNGASGADAMFGGAGLDVYFVDNAGDFVLDTGATIDEIRTSLFSFTLSEGAGIEQLLGTTNDGHLLTGNSGNNTLTGGAGRDTLNGGAGIDVMFGGAGSDVYLVDNFGDVAVEALGPEIDEIRTSLSVYTLGEGTGIEQLLGLLNTGQTLTGNSGDNTISGGGGNDFLNGFAGADAMFGGLGSDIYIVDNVGDFVSDGGTSVDEIRTSLFSYTLVDGSGIEQLLGLNGSGHILVGNSANNTLSGGGGADTLEGGAGADALIGGAGADIFRYVTTSASVSAARDVVLDFASADKIDVSAIDAINGGANDDFVFIGANAFNGTAGQLRIYQSGDFWFVDGDTNGDAQADLSIQLATAGYTPGASNIIGLVGGSSGSANTPAMLLMSLAEAGLPDNRTGQVQAPLLPRLASEEAVHRGASDPIVADPALLALAQVEYWSGAPLMVLPMASGDLF